jgi:hypothetical protein
MTIFNSILRAFRVVRVMPPAINPIYDGDRTTNGDLSCDGNGALWVRVLPEVASVDILAANASNLSPLRFNYRAPNNSMFGIIALNEGAMLTQFGGFNDSNVEYYVQIFNSNDAPVNGDIPDQQFHVLSDSSFVWNPSRGARAFTGPNSGISWAISTQKNQLMFPAVYRSNFIYAEGYEGPTP